MAAALAAEPEPGEEPERAERHLAALKSICVLPCEEYDDLKGAVDAYLLGKAR